MPATDRIIAAVKQQTATGKGLRDAVKDEIRAIFAAVLPHPAPIRTATCLTSC